MDGDASGEIAELYGELKQTSMRGNVPDILRTMSLRSIGSTPRSVRRISKGDELLPHVHGQFNFEAVVGAGPVSGSSPPSSSASGSGPPC